MHRMLAWILLAGCGSSSERGGASCETRAADLAAWATKVDHTYGGGLMASDKLVEDRDALPVTLGQRGSAISVTHDTISVDGRPATGADEIAAGITESSHRQPAGVLMVFIDRDAPIALVAAAVAGAVAAGANDVELGVARPVTPMTPPPRSSVTDELAVIAAGAPSERATAIAYVMQRVVSGCPAIVRAYGMVASEETRSKAQVLIDALQPALAECSCNLDLDAFRSTLWALLGPGVRPPAGVVRVTLAPADDLGAAIATGATWADAAPALFAAAAAGKRVRIVAPGSR